LTRDAVLASSNGGAAVNWPAGTRQIRAGWPAWLALPRYLAKSVAGGAGTTVLTQNEQRGHVLEFTGALTGNRILEVDNTPWEWTVYNNTSGAFSLTLRVTGQTGVTIPQGKRVQVHCDGADVRGSATDFVGSTSLSTLTVAGALTAQGLVDISAAGAGQIKFPAAQNSSSNANTLDDYEEGTWTPALTFGGGSTGISYTVQIGKYTKVGNVVTYEWIITLFSKGSSTGAANITGAPFTNPLSGGCSSIAPVEWSSMTSTLVNMTAFSPINSAVISLNGITAAATASSTSLTDTAFANNSTLNSTMNVLVAT
jgi:hypothetical protein